MEPLNLMVSLSHFANDKREHKHGLSERAGRGRDGEPHAEGSSRPERARGWWRNSLRGVTRFATR